MRSITTAMTSRPSQLAGRRLASYIERVCASPKGNEEPMREYAWTRRDGERNGKAVAMTLCPSQPASFPSRMESGTGPSGARRNQTEPLNPGNALQPAKTAVMTSRPSQQVVGRLASYIEHVYTSPKGNEEAMRE